MPRLRKIKLTEGSLVTRGANQHADVVLFKSDGGLAKGAGAKAIEAAAEAGDVEQQARKLIDGVMAGFYQGQDTLQAAVRLIAADKRIADKPAAVKEAVATLLGREPAKDGKEPTLKHDIAKADTISKQANETVDEVLELCRKASLGDREAVKKASELLRDPVVHAAYDVRIAGGRYEHPAPVEKSETDFRGPIRKFVGDGDFKGLRELFDRTPAAGRQYYELLAAGAFENVRPL